MWKSPLDEGATEMAYAKNQVTKVMSFDDFVKHISDHNGVFTRGTVKGVVSDTCSCLVEQLLNGNKVQFGELGIFSISITCDPAPSLKEFTADNIKAVRLNLYLGKRFRAADLYKDAKFREAGKYDGGGDDGGETAGTHDEGSNTSGGNMPDGGSTDDSADVGLE